MLDFHPRRVREVISVPLYEYVCEKCGAEEELLVSMSEADRDRQKCEICGGKMKRVFSVTADCKSQSGGGGGGKEFCQLGGG